MRKFFPLDAPFPPIVIPLAAAFLALAALHGPVRAQSQRAFVIAAQDGYGVSECVAARAECGRVVADAWCEGHGLGKASAYGSADDVTGAIEIRTSAQPPKGSVVITCGE